MAVEFCKVGVTRMLMTHNWKCNSHSVTEERKKILGGLGGSEVARSL